MLDQHMQIGLGKLQPDDQAWSRNWFGWDPMVPQQELWDHNCEVWRVRPADMVRFWGSTNRVLSLVAMETKKVVVVAQVTALLRVVDIDETQIHERYLNRIAFRGRVLVDHPAVGTDWEYISPGTRQWPVQMVKGALDLSTALVPT